MSTGPFIPTIPASAYLSLCDLFSDIDPALLQSISSELQLVNLPRGEVLVRQGEPAGCMYSIVSGQVRLVVDGEDGTEKLLTELRSGDTVGVVDLIDGQPRMATVRATRDTKLVQVSEAGFRRLVCGNVGALEKVNKIMARSLRSLTNPEQSISATRMIAIFDSADPTAGFDFSQKLCDSLAKFGKVLYLSQERFQRIYRRPFHADSRYAAWLGDLEAEYDFIVLQAGQPSEWAEHCARQADRILTVCRAWLAPELSILEKQLFDQRIGGKTPQVELVLLHQESSRTFTGTAAWLSGREVLRHHHIRVQVAGDIHRVARILAGRAIGLTLGGGGARAFAHIGIIRAIEEAGIPIDMICGVSMGAILGGQYAMGWDWQEMIRMNRKVLAGNKLNRDFTLPLISLTSGRRLRHALRTFFGETAIEDLWLNYFCTSCNLTTSELVIHRSGRLWISINASNSIPVLLPAVVSDGHMLVDGGILNNQPGDLMKQACSGPVIVVCVSPKREVLVDEAFTEMPSSWQVLRSRLNPFKPSIKVPGIPATMMRALMVASNRKSREVEQEAEFYLRPPIDRFRLDNLDRMEEIADVGYQYAKEEIRKWKESDRLDAVLRVR